MALFKFWRNLFLIDCDHSWSRHWNDTITCKELLNCYSLPNDVVCVKCGITPFIVIKHNWKYHSVTDGNSDIWIDGKVCVNCGKQEQTKLQLLEEYSK